MANNFAGPMEKDALKFYSGAKRLRRMCFSRADLLGKNFLFEKERRLRRLYAEVKWLGNDTDAYHKLSVMKGVNSQVIKACQSRFKGIKGDGQSAVAFAIAIGLPQESVQLLNNLWADALPSGAILKIKKFVPEEKSEDYVEKQRGIGAALYGVSSYEIVLAGDWRIFPAKGGSILRRDEESVGHMEIESCTVPLSASPELMGAMIGSLREKGGFIGAKASRSGQSYRLLFLKDFSFRLEGRQMADVVGGCAGYLAGKLHSYGLSPSAFSKFLKKHTGIPLGHLYLHKESFSVSLEACNPGGVVRLCRKIGVSPQGELSGKEVLLDLESRIVGLVENGIDGEGNRSYKMDNVWPGCRRRD